MSVDDREGVLEDPSKLSMFFRSRYESELGKFLESYDPDRMNIFEVEYSELFAYDSDLADDYLNAPKRIQNDLAAGLASVNWSWTDPETGREIELKSDAIDVRVTQLPPHAVYDVGQYRLDDVDGTYGGVRGQVSKRTQKKEIIEVAKFECVRCGVLTTIPQGNDDSLDEPNQCQGCERNGPFNIDQRASEKRAYQRVRLQLPPEKAATATDETIDAVFHDDLVDEVEPGDRIVVNGQLESELQYNGQTPTRLLELEMKADSIDMLESDFEEIDIEEHRDRIEEIAGSANPIEQVVESIAPSIRGRNDIKEAIALQMFGGVEKELPDGAHKRGDLHILVVGDPGCGKSALLQYAKRLSPRAVYTSGKQSTAAGLTGAAVQDEFGDGGWTIDAGALVEAHKGLAAIDEFDKMDAEDQSGVMQAMSEQEISISKAGINATLPAKTTVLAAANPRDGRFDKYDPVGSQIELDPAIFSRFDLVFTISDSPDEELDRHIASHMADVARIGQELANGDHSPADAEKATPEIEPEVMQAYIAYARRLNPVLTPEANQRIVNEYVNVRSTNDDDGPIPTTARMNEALIRLAEASARVRLSEKITEEDAAHAIAIHRRCLEDVGIDPETDEFDADLMETGTSKAQRDRVQLVKSLIKELDAETDFGGAGHEKIVELGEENGFTRSKIEKTLKNLKRQGEAYEPTQDQYRLS
ncbi:MAG: minichromosome maintenance protein MCM [Natronomonas sp.]|uniref:minichromosome maintenance protein MCM n=1 Tax=Natronomonas sp. TaxID=2184060 RepID=UPI0028700635|nr:minichromosome maintenance protein MCM [Natronomonas sp.]MDR9381571.1 minichromosome maintenance protein MCM [Natronomonas sp.]MDR9432067.1 minichromosome maintenance protein MCM [Natronomonas sp.]